MEPETRSSALSYAKMDLSNHAEGVWQSDMEVDACTLCDVKFTMIKRKHHCRKCGGVICGNCSKTKMKLTPSAPTSVRVCDKCYREGTKTTVVAATESVMVIYPPVWQSTDGVTSCFKCKRQAGGIGIEDSNDDKSTKTSSLLGKLSKAKHAVVGRKQLHNCRTCGRIFCSACTQKQEVPECFRQKAKPGPVRVCEMCLMLLAAGAELSQVASPTDVNEEPPPPPDSDEEDDDFTGNPLAGIMDSKPPGHARNISSASGLSSSVPPSLLGIMWENKPNNDSTGDNTEAEQLIARLPTLPNMTLSKIHAMLLRQAPDMSSYETSQWAYLCNGEEIKSAHYHVFEARHFIGGMLFIRFKSSRGRSSSVANAIDSAIAGAKQKKMQAIQEAEEQKKRVAAAPKAKPKFHTKFAAVDSSAKTRDVDVSDKALGADKGKPPGFKDSLKAKVEHKSEEASSSAGLASGVDMARLKDLDPFKARSVGLFGANLDGANTEAAGGSIIELDDDPEMVPPPPDF
eukprot:CAMPEP_0175141684 /NCGR_PEP_ID=MMETSP0087-20121206/12288_1 /TAXON_ID=136419 /ORGANISM="Unknown Unknown, Strain D1" /LENGTH=513 /DNA_ID=CAMNT_0016425219 /DNA_START=38 /DNA_END=1579 /DNA_ORIENTATION=-